MARSWYTRSYAKPQFIQTPRVQAVARERAFLRRNRNVPFLFGHTDDVAVSLRKRARDRMHTIAREQAYMRTAQFGQYKLNKYRTSMTRHPASFGKWKGMKLKPFQKLRKASKYVRLRNYRDFN